MSDERVEETPKEQANRTVTTKEIKETLSNASDLGHPITGHIKRDGDTFEDKELGEEWDASFDSTEKLLERIENGNPNES